MAVDRLTGVVSIDDVIDRGKREEGEESRE